MAESSKLSGEAKPFTATGDQKNPGRGDHKESPQKDRGGKGRQRGAKKDNSANTANQSTTSPQKSTLTMEEAKALGEQRRKQLKEDELKRRAEMEAQKNSNPKLQAIKEADRAQKDSLKAEKDHRKKAAAAFSPVKPTEDPSPKKNHTPRGGRRDSGHGSDKNTSGDNAAVTAVGGDTTAAMGSGGGDSLDPRMEQSRNHRGKGKGEASSDARNAGKNKSPYAANGPQERSSDLGKGNERDRGDRQGGKGKKGGGGPDNSKNHKESGQSSKNGKEGKGKGKGKEGKGSKGRNHMNSADQNDEVAADSSQNKKSANDSKKNDRPSNDRSSGKKRNSENSFTVNEPVKNAVVSLTSQSTQPSNQPSGGASEETSSESSAVAVVAVPDKGPVGASESTTVSSTNPSSSDISSPPESSLSKEDTPVKDVSGASVKQAKTFKPVSLVEIKAKEEAVKKHRAEVAAKRAALHAQSSQTQPKQQQQQEQQPIPLHVEQEKVENTIAVEAAPLPQAVAGKGSDSDNSTTAVATKEAYDSTNKHSNKKDKAPKTVSPYASDNSASATSAKPAADTTATAAASKVEAKSEVKTSESDQRKHKNEKVDEALVKALKSHRLGKYISSAAKHNMDLAKFSKLQTNAELETFGVSKRDFASMRKLIASLNNGSSSELQHDTVSGDASGASGGGGGGGGSKDKGSIEDAKNAGAERRRLQAEEERKEKQRRKELLDQKSGKLSLTRATETKRTTVGSREEQCSDSRKKQSQSNSAAVTTRGADGSRNEALNYKSAAESTTSEKSVSSFDKSKSVYAAQQKHQEKSIDNGKKFLSSNTPPNAVSLKSEKGASGRFAALQPHQPPKLDLIGDKNNLENLVHDALNHINSLGDKPILELDINKLRNVLKEAKRLGNLYSKTGSTTWCSESKDENLMKVKKQVDSYESKFKIEEAKRMGREKREKEKAEEKLKQQKKEEEREKLRLAAEEAEQKEKALELERKTLADNEAKAKGEARRQMQAEEAEKKRKQAAEAAALRHSTMVSSKVQPASHVGMGSSGHSLQDNARRLDVNQTEGGMSSFRGFGKGGKGGGDVPKSRHGVSLSGIDDFRSENEKKKAREEWSQRMEMEKPNPYSPSSFPSLSESHNPQWQAPQDSRGSNGAVSSGGGGDARNNDVSRANRIIGHSLGREINTHVRELSKAQSAAARAVQESNQVKASQPSGDSFNSSPEEYNNSADVINAASGTVWGEKDKLSRVSEAVHMSTPLRLAPKPQMVALSQGKAPVVTTLPSSSSSVTSSKPLSKPSSSFGNGRIPQPSSRAHFATSSSSVAPAQKSLNNRTSHYSNERGGPNNTNFNDNRPPNSNYNSSIPQANNSTGVGAKKATSAPVSVINPATGDLKVELLPVASTSAEGEGTPLMSPPVGWGKKAAKWGDYDSDEDSD